MVSSELQVQAGRTARWSGPDRVWRNPAPRPAHALVIAALRPVTECLNHDLEALGDNSALYSNEKKGGQLPGNSNM